MIWREAIKKEREHLSRGGQNLFTVNPYKLRATTLPQQVSTRGLKFLNKDASALQAAARLLQHRSLPEVVVAKPSTPNAPAAPLLKDSGCERRPNTAGQNTGGRDLSRPSPSRTGRTSVKSLLRRLRTAPSDKFAEPQTSAQEVGWLSTPLGRPTNTFSYNRTHCDITKYASDFVKGGGGGNPFAASRKR